MLQSSTKSTEALLEENKELLASVRSLHQQLVNERARLCHITAARVDAEHRLKVCLYTHKKLLIELDFILVSE